MIGHTEKLTAAPNMWPTNRGLSKSGGSLQRICTCGQHGGGGECEECRARHRLQGKDLGVSQNGNQILRSPGQVPDQEEGAFRAPRFQHDFSRIQASRQERSAKVQGAPANEFEDCPADWRKETEAALVIGRRWVNNVVVGLSNLSTPIPAPIATLLSRHFHTTDAKKIGEITKHFLTINKALNSPIDFECEKTCKPRVAAYVYTIWTDLHLCPLWHSLGPDMQANTIVHEVAHDAANRDDEAYIWQPEYAKLSVDDAIDNADSYSNFAQEAS